MSLRIKKNDYSISNMYVQQFQYESSFSSVGLPGAYCIHKHAQMQTGSICLICILTMSTQSRSICKHRHIQVKLTPDIKNHEKHMQGLIVLCNWSSLREVHT